MKVTMRKVVALVLMLSLVFSIAGCSKFKTGALSAPAYRLDVGDTPPDFRVELTNGDKFTLSEQKGKIVVLNFWASWCGPCVGEMPAFQNIYMIYGDKISICTINVGESKDVVKAFADNNGYIFPIAYDPNEEVSKLYPFTGIPYTVIIDQEGKVSRIFRGASDALTQSKEYMAAIDAIS